MDPRAKERPNRNKMLEVLSEATARYLEFPFASVDYQLIADNLLQLSGASYVIINSFDEPSKEAITETVAGESEELAKAFAYLGFNPIGKRWPISAESKTRHLPGRLIQFSGIHDLSFQQIPRHIAARVEKLLGISSIYAIGLFHHGYILGNLVMLWRTGGKLEEPDIIELFARQVAALLLRKKVEQALQESEERYRQLVRLLPDGIVIHCRGKVVFANPAAARLMGCANPDELVGKPVIDYVHPDNVEVFRARARQVIKERKVGPLLEQKLIRPDGKIITVEIVSVPFTYQNEPAVQAVLHDVTERKQLEEELIKASKFDSLVPLAGGIAHDFNNILAVIQGRVSLARMFIQDKHRLNQNLIAIEKAVKQAAELTHQLLTFARDNAPIKETVDLGELIKEATTFALSGSSVQCKFSLPADLWPVEIDRGQINQVINNLIINAVQAMPEGGTVYVAAENYVVTIQPTLPLRPGQYVKISIRDEGVGIPEEYLPKIFDPYFTTKQTGSGLGLAISYSIIKRHDGHIAVESRPAVGTTFYIYLPASPYKVFAEKIEETKVYAGKGRILIMDDVEEIRHTVVEMLSFLGYEVKLARDGAETVELYKKARETGRPFDVVIMDLTIRGGIGGRQTIARLREIDPHVKAIVSSGYPTNPAMIHFRQYGFRGRITKPYKITTLSKVLQQVIADNKN